MFFLGYLHMGFERVPGLLAVGLFAVGHFAVGQLALQTLLRVDTSP